MPSRRPSPPPRPPAPRRAPGPSWTARLDGWSERHGRVALMTMMMLQAVTLTALCGLKYRSYLYLDIDLPLFTQAVAGVLHGTLYSSIRGMDWLGDHSSLVLFLTAGPFALLRHPMTLLGLQSVALALGAWPAYALARRELGAGFAPLGLAACWLLYPALGYAALYEFHPEVLCSAALMATFACYRAGRLGPAALFAALTLLGKEDAVLPIAALALYALLARRPRHVAFAIAFAALAAASAGLSFGVLKPMLNRGEVAYGQMYAAWGSNPGEIAGHLLTHPLAALGAFFTDPGNPVGSAVKQQYYLHLLLPLLFVPLLSPLTLALALPTLATHFLSDRVAQHTIYYQYTAYVTPFVFAAAILGARRMLERMKRPGAAATLALTLLAATLFCGFLFGPVFGHGLLQTAASEQHTFPTGQDRAIAAQRDQLLASLPSEGAVVAGSEFLGRLTARAPLYAFLNTVSGTYTYSIKSYPQPRQVRALIADFAAEPLQRFVDGGTSERLRSLLRHEELTVVRAAGDNLLFVKGAFDTLGLMRVGEAPIAAARAIEFDGRVRFLGVDRMGAGAVPGGLLPVRTAWRLSTPTDSLYWEQLAAYDEQGHAVFSVTRPVGYLYAPVHAWPVGIMVREDYRLIVPDDCPPGTYMLGLRLGRYSATGAVLADTDDPGTRQKNMVVELGRFTVGPRP